MGNEPITGYTLHSWNLGCFCWGQHMGNFEFNDNKFSNHSVINKNIGSFRSSWVWLVWFLLSIGIVVNDTIFHLLVKVTNRRAGCNIIYPFADPNSHADVQVSIQVGSAAPFTTAKALSPSPNWHQDVMLWAQSRTCRTPHVHELLLHTWLSSV